VCARPAVPASVYQIVAGRSFHGTTAGRAFTSVGYSETKIKTASPTRAACEECRAPDQPTSRTRPPRWSPPRGRPKPDGWPPLSLHALTRVRMPVVSARRPGQSPAAAVRPEVHMERTKAICPASNVVRFTADLCTGSSTDTGVQDPAAGLGPRWRHQPRRSARP
jgi:hypothetical protein